MCGADISFQQALAGPGWERAESGVLPGKLGNPCWLRIDVSPLAPKVLSISGSAGYKTVTVFDARGQRLAEAHDYGSREQAIVGSSDFKARMLFPLVGARDGWVYARVDRSRYRIEVQAEDLAASVQADREYDFLHFGLAVLYAVFAAAAALLAIANRDRGQIWFALFFATMVVGEWAWTGMSVSLTPNFEGARWFNNGFALLHYFLELEKLYCLRHAIFGDIKIFGS